MQIFLLFIINFDTLLIPALTLMFPFFNQIELIKLPEQKSLTLTQLWCSIFIFAVTWGSSFRTIHQIFEISTRRGLQMWEVGFWLHWQLWGKEVSQSRKWLDLPCVRLAHPDNNPHSSEHPGSPQAPTEDCRSTAESQGWKNLLIQVAKFLKW